MRVYLTPWMILSLAIGVGCYAASPASAQGWGKVKGQLVFGGAKAPEKEKLDVNKDKDHCLSKGPIYSQEWEVNEKNLGIKNVFVWLAPLKPDGELPIHPDLKNPKNKPLEIDQPCCKFVPHCLAVRQGQTVVVKNSAPITHNFRWTGHPINNPGGNINMPAGSDFKIENLKADRFPVAIKCDIHQWMSGWIRVFDHPYYALTDKDGNFQLPNAPAGQYRLYVWHPASGWLGGKAGRFGQVITIPDDGVVDMKKLEITK